MTPLWRKRPLHERLAREGGLLGEPPPVDPRPPVLETGIHGIARAREWDAVVSVEAAGLPGAELSFVALADRTLLVEDDLPDDVLAPLAEAVEQELEPPYRAGAVRREGDLWAVAANRIEVVDLEDDPGGDELELAVREGHRTLLVDGEQVFGGVPALERLAGGRYESYVVRAARLDGSLWEVRTAPL